MELAYICKPIFLVSTTRQQLVQTHLSTGFRLNVLIVTKEGKIRVAKLLPEALVTPNSNNQSGMLFHQCAG